MISTIKQLILGSARSLGIYHVINRSKWRTERLLILCYHGLSIRDEHDWSGLYVTPQHFRRRIGFLFRNGYSVLPLGEAVTKLREGLLPSKSVAITFDDGFYDFYLHALPVIQEYSVPVTLYQTTYYCSQQYPIFNLVLSYLLWRGRNKSVDGFRLGLSGTLDLTREDTRNTAVSALLRKAKELKLDDASKDSIAAELSAQLGQDYQEVRDRRILHLMTLSELREAARAGIDVQLHTHRHRTPMDEGLFVQEIRDNRNVLAAATGTSGTHFCYPSGVYHPEFLPWLRSENIESATTCNLGFASRHHDPLVLPRLLDSMSISEVNFEGWLSGFCAFLPNRQS
jgi:peptidoglycan/xylan/chitin deacetylase (PgdA/CDA1 family)